MEDFGPDMIGVLGTSGFGQAGHKCLLSEFV